MKLLLIFPCLLSVSFGDDLNSRYFPANFKFGVANAAPQIEGAWDEDGKGETVWDHFAHNYPDRIVDHSTPDVACDSYHKYKEDVAMIKAMGLEYYRLSIAWSRVLPTGYTDEVNQLGVEYYKNLFAELKANNIEPLVTLYHWDLPQPLEDSLGGWLNSTVADLFAEYARLCYQLFGDDVKMWITINEPKQVCQAGYGSGIFAPAVVSNGIGEYICAYNVLLAHAKAYHIYDDEFRADQGGKVSMVIDSSWFEPGSDSEADQEAADRILQFNLGLYGNPVYVGNWPQVVIDRVAMRSELEGFPTSRLPAFSDEEVEYIKGTYDYIALNHYATNMAGATEEAAIGDPSYGNDISVLTWVPSDWPMGSASWFGVYPLGFRKMLAWLKNNYADVEIFVTENGMSDTTGILEDDHRISYFQTYLSAALDAIYEDGVNLTGYMAWSIMDDWEWNGGFTFADDYVINNNTFPSTFKFGVATAAYQIEGGWDADGKGPSVWDYWIHNNPNKVLDHTNGDITCDSYHKYKEDVALMKQMGVNHYRFSISWPRILPEGYTYKINQAGVDYYLDLLKELQENDIEAMVTLLHWDHPQAIQDIGGWTNSAIVDLFGDYARLCYRLFGEYVQTWTTINEPKQICQAGYGSGSGSGVFAPGIISPGIGEYLCAQNILRAHARAYHFYDEEFRSTQGGRISLVIDSDWNEPASDSAEDKEAAEWKRQFTFGLYAHPVYLGNWPQIVIERVSMRSEKEGFEKSRLPTFTDEEIAYINGTFDYMGLNHYTTYMVNATTEPEIGAPSWEKDTGVIAWQKDEWETAATDWFKVVPWGMRKLLNWVKTNYNDVEIIITENGVSDKNGTLEDTHRITYFKNYLSNVLDAIYDDEVNVTGYTAWSIIDNFEWIVGYTAKLGMYYVDFDDPDRPRTAKQSATYYTNVISTHCLLDQCVES